MKKILKFCVSILLIGFLISQADWTEIRAHLALANKWALFFVFLILTIQFPISTYKWGRCLQIHHIHFPFPVLQKFICIGFFFNNFLPTAIGGDAYRIVKTFPETGGKSPAVSAVLLERIIGFLALLFIGFGFALWSFSTYPTLLIKWYIILGFTGITAAGIGVFLYSQGFIKNFVKKKLSGSKFEFLLENLRSIKKNKAILSSVLLTSFLFQILAVIGIYLLFRSIGIHNSFAACALIAALSGIVTVLPISLNGIGVVEGAFVYTATQFGVGFDEAVIAAFILRAFTIPLSIICGIVYLLDSKTTLSEGKKS